MKDFLYTLPVGSILHSPERDYIVESVLGQGGFGITYKVSSKVKVGNISVKTFFAMKEFFMKSSCEREESGTIKYSTPVKDSVEDGLRCFIKEAKRLNEVCKYNRNIVDVNEVFEANGTAYFVMEYLDGGDLRQVVKNSKGGLTEAEAVSIIKPIAEALQVMHSRKFLHLDIKPDNIVMRRGENGQKDEPVLIDFGVSVHFDKTGHITTTHNNAGYSVGYSPIEQYCGIDSFSPWCDVYALSATFLYLLTGKDPMGAYDLTKERLLGLIPTSVSEETRKAIMNGMKKDYHERTQTMEAFLAELSGACGAVVEEKTNETQTIKKARQKSAGKLPLGKIATCSLGLLLFVLIGVGSCAYFRLSVLGGDDDLDRFKDTDSVVVDTLVRDEAFLDTASSTENITKESEVEAKELRTNNKTQKQSVSRTKTEKVKSTSDKQSSKSKLEWKGKIPNQEVAGQAKKEAERMEVSNSNFVPEYTGGGD